MSESSYRAFITYSHTDSDSAARLQRDLESFRVPSRLVGKPGTHGLIERRIGAVFRDREELSAGAKLSETLYDALARSEYLIVVCSPAARQSRWVDLEIAQFKKTHNSDKILCYIVDGEPLAANEPATAHLECFPEALGYLNADGEDQAAEEIVAADLRDSGDGRRLAKLKIISGLLGIGLDELIQRDAQRRNRNLIFVTVALALGMVIMSALTFVAVEARNGEQLRRAEAEDLIEFMLSDLRDRLDAVGRLDVLEAVGEKTIDYYSKVALSEHSESSLGRRARAFHLLGEVDDLEGDIQGARDAFQMAFQSTTELLSRAPNDAQRIFDHSQSVFWVGYLDWRLGDLVNAESAFREYVSLAEQLIRLDPANPDWQAEWGHSNINLGVYYYQSGNADDALEYFQAAYSVFDELGAQDPSQVEWQRMRAQSLAWLADASEDTGLLRAARKHRTTESAIYTALLESEPKNRVIYQNLTVSQNALADIAIAEGDLAAAVVVSKRAQNYAHELMALDPENTFYAYTASNVDSTLAEALIYQDEFNEAAIVLNQAMQESQRLLAQDASVLEWTLLDSKLQIFNGKLKVARQAPDEAIASLAITGFELNQLLASHPDNHEVMQLLALAHAITARANEIRGDRIGVSTNLKSILSLLGPIEDRLPLRYLALLSQACAVTGDADRAARIDDRLQAAGYKHPGNLGFAAANFD